MDLLKSFNISKIANDKIKEIFDKEAKENNCKPQELNFVLSIDEADEICLVCRGWNYIHIFYPCIHKNDNSIP